HCTGLYCFNTLGPISLHEYTHFTPVCTTELGAVARLQSEWDSRGVLVIGLSCSSLQDHHTGSKTSTRLRPNEHDKAGMPLTVRSEFNEILRVVDSLQLCDSKKVATPANWTVGEEVIVHNSLGNEEAEKPYLRYTKL
ncbi:hypothetical protein BCR33DRAFT_717369, partial [Rhizoclosmatium globosum]